MTLLTINNYIKEVFNTFLYWFMSFFMLVVSNSNTDFLYIIITFNLTCIFTYVFLNIFWYNYKNIIYLVDSKTFYVYLWLKILIFGYLIKYLDTMYFISKELGNNKNNYCFYYLGKTISLIFFLLAVMPLFCPIFTIYILLGFMLNIDLIEFITNYSLLMDSGNSGGGPSGNFGGGPFGDGNFGGDPRNNTVFVSSDLRRETQESKRPQGDFPFVAPTEAYMKLLKETVSPYHYEKIFALQRDFPNAKIRDWSAFKLFDATPVKQETNYYYFDIHGERRYKKTYFTGSFHHDELMVYKHGTTKGMMLGRQPLPDVGGLYYNSGTKQTPIYTQYDPRISIEQLGEKVIYIDKGVGRGLESINMHTTSVTRRIINW